MDFNIEDIFNNNGIIKSAGNAIGSLYNNPTSISTVVGYITGVAATLTGVAISRLSKFDSVIKHILIELDKKGYISDLKISRAAIGISTFKFNGEKFKVKFDKNDAYTITNIKKHFNVVGTRKQNQEMDSFIKQFSQDISRAFSAS